MAGTYAKYSGSSSGGSGGAFANQSLSNLTSPTAVNQNLNLTDHVLYGSNVAGDNLGAGSPTAGNLILSSTSNATPGYVGVTDGSPLNIGPQSFITNVYTNWPGTPSGGLYVATDAQGVSYGNALNSNVFEMWGGTPDLTLVGSGGTSSSLAYFTSGQVTADLAFAEYNGGPNPLGNSKFTANVQVFAAENHSSSAFGNYIEFGLTKIGTSSRKGVLDILGSGAVLMGGTSAFSSGVNLSWSVDGAGTIGAQGANRPSAVYSAGSVNAGTHLGVGNSAAATTLGSVVKKIEIFDNTGASLGFIPVYNSIT